MIDQRRRSPEKTNRQPLIETGRFGALAAGEGFELLDVPEQARTLEQDQRESGEPAIPQFAWRSFFKFDGRAAGTVEPLRQFGEPQGFWIPAEPQAAAARTLDQADHLRPRVFDFLQDPEKRRLDL